MSTVVELETIGKKLTIAAKDATGGGATGTTYWTSTTVFAMTCPANTRWILLGGHVYRSQNGTLVGVVKNDDDFPIYYLTEKGAGTGNSGIPDVIYGYGKIILDPADYIQLTFGVAQDANAVVSINVLEIPL